MANFRIDWQKKKVSCPQERQSIRWSKTKTARGRKMIHVEFDPDDCAACPSRPLCTRAKSLPRTLTLQPKEEHEAIQVARRRQKTEEFASVYSRRAGVEGTISQGVLKPSGYARLATGAWGEPTYRRWPPPRRSMWVGWPTG